MSRIQFEFANKDAIIELFKKRPQKKFFLEGDKRAIVKGIAASAFRDYLRYAGFYYVPAKNDDFIEDLKAMKFKITRGHPSLNTSVVHTVISLEEAIVHRQSVTIG
jgi:hypothetical protein